MSTVPNKFTSEVELIDPDTALRYLARNASNNRRTKETKIEAYSRDMRAGAWPLTGEAIQFDTDGRLIDGQNRLHAVVRAGVAVQFLVVRGVTPTAMALLDSGAARTPGDSIQIAGLTASADPKDVAAVSRLHIAYTQGVITHAMSYVGGSARVTKPELIAHVIANPGLDHASRFARTVYRDLRLPVSAIGVAYIEFSRIDPDAAEKFFGRIRDGVLFGQGDPFLVLQRRVSSDREGRGSIAPATGLFYLFRTWNAWVTGESMRKLQIGSLASGWVELPKLKKPIRGFSTLEAVAS